ncbi:MAG: HAMP domain-containing sensor histidine kinase [Ferruginibacter sp.]
MKITKIKLIVTAGTIAFISIIAVQIYLLRQAFDYEEKKFSQNIQVSLLEVAREINAYYGYALPHVNPIEKISEDYYIVNLRNDFEASVLELLLINKFKAKGIHINFEYAIYDCNTDAMIYGSYVRLDKSVAKKAPATYFPKANNLVYYFAVRIPNKNSFIYASLKVWVILCLAMIITLSIYLYAIYIILQQQRYANLQRDFINNMTHEFKTPLASILIASGFLSKQDAIDQNDKFRQYCRIIIDQGKKLDDHLEKILNVAKNDSSPLLLHKEPVDILASINKTIEIIHLKYPDAKITVINDAANVVIMADAFHFSNMIYNFLDNAIKYCEQQPAIEIELKDNSGGHIITIKDNGVGIAPKYLRHIFEKFYRAPQSSELAVNGFGLGLYYCHKICELHHWKLRATSVAGKGTEITLIMK